MTGEEANAALGRGINIGNSLEAPREGDWGAGLDASHFAIIADAGFTHVRLPVSWSAYASWEPPYTIPDGNDPAVAHPEYNNIWERVDWAIEQAELNNLMLIVNLHHYDEIHVDPAAHTDRFLAMWQQIAPRYQDAGDHVVFELLNEPQAVFTEQPQLWNDLAASALAIVRETNPERPVLIGPVGYNHIDFLDDLVLPDDDYLITTVHLYEPFAFTHQGATWMDPVPPIGVPWSADGFALPRGVYDRSWDSRIITENDQLRVDFQRQWAGVSFDYLDAVAPTELRLAVAGNGSLRIGCRIPGNDELDTARITTNADRQEITVDLSSCPAEATGISMMNASPNSDPLLFDSIVVCTSRGCDEMLTSADAALRGWLSQAGEWGRANDMPVHLGEFGAFGAEGRVPIGDRAEWTATVVDEASAQGISMSYWEFHAGYAAYDLNTNTWVAELKNALLN